MVFTQANPVAELGPECSAVFAEYSGLLSSQGRLETAATYLKGNVFKSFVRPDHSCYKTASSSHSLSLSFPLFLPLYLPSLSLSLSLSHSHSLLLRKIIKWSLIICSLSLFYLGVNIQETILIDRLYHANSSPAVGSRPPVFPFERVVVSASQKAPTVVAAVTQSVVANPR